MLQETAVQAALVRSRLAAGDQIAGYKGGFIPAAPVGGVLGASGMLTDGSKIRASDFRLLIVEAEIAFRFCAAVSQPLADIAALQDNAMLYPLGCDFFFTCGDQVAALPRSTQIQAEG